MDYPFLGWIPCINGHLNFGLMRPGIIGGFTDKESRDEKTNCINFGYLKQNDHHARKVMMQSKVDWRDKLSKDDYDGFFRVFVLAEAEQSESMDSRSLKGSLYMYPVAEHETTKENNHQKTWFDLIHKAEEIYDLREHKPWHEIRDKLNKYYDDLSKSLLEQRFWKIDFHISSSGLIYLRPSDESCKNRSEQDAFLVTRQAYYYIKYSLHSHKHHQSEQDALTSIVNYDATTDGKHQAALKLICQLKRELTSIKRTLTQEQRFHSDDALGILAYMASLLTSLYYEGWVDEKTFQREKSYQDALKSSFQVQDSRVNHSHAIEEETRSKYRVYFGWTLAVSSLFFAVIARPFYTAVPADLQISLSIDFAELVGLFILVLLVVAVVYNSVVNKMVRLRLDEKSFRHFVLQRYKFDFPGMAARFLMDHWPKFLLLINLVLGACGAYWLYK